MMDYQVQNETATPIDASFVYEKLHDANVTTDVTGEFNLPDYLPPVEKLLRVRAVPSLGGKYMSGEKVEFEGDVKWEILYRSDEGALCAFSANTAFGESCPVHNLDENCIVTVNTEVQNPMCRLSGPRKMTLRCQCETAVTSVTLRQISPEIAAQDGDALSADPLDTVETDQLQAESCRFWCAEDNGIRCSEDIETESNILSEIISTDCRAIMTGAKAQDGKIDYRADVYFTVLCRCADEEAGCISVQKHFPISRQVEVEGIADGAVCFGECDVKDLTVQLGTDRLGEMRRIELDYILNCTFTACQNQRTAVVRDAFSVRYPAQLQTQNCRILKHRKTDCVNFTVSGMIPMGEAGAGRVITAGGDVRDLTVRADKNKFAIGGYVDLNVLLTEPENGGVLAAEGEVPFQYEAASDGFMGDIDKRMECTVTDVNARIEGNQVRVDMEIRLCFQVLEKANLPYVSAITLLTEEPLPDQEEAIVIYYPRPGESLWEIAKRYQVSPNAIREANNLEAGRESIAPGERILAIER